MAKTEIVYSTQSTGYEKGRAYANPRFFITPRTGVQKVIVVGNWPAVVEAYRALGVTVVEVETGHATLEEAIAGGREMSGKPPEVPLDTSAIDIPDAETFEALDWSEKRQLVKSLGGSVTNKEAAREFVDAARAARAEGKAPEASATE